MVQANQYRPLSQQSGVPLDYDATDEHSIQVFAQDPIAVPSGQATSLQDILLSRYLSDPGASSITSMHPLIPPGMVEEQDNMALLEDYFLRQDLASATHPGMVEEQGDMPFVDDYLFRRDLADIKSITNYFSFDENTPAQPGDVRSPSFFPSNGTLGFPTSHMSPVGPPAEGHLSSLDLTFNPQGRFQFPPRGNEHSQAGNGQVPFVTSRGAADSPTPWSIIGSSPQSAVWPSGHTSSLDFPDINPQYLSQFPLGGNEHSQQSQPGNSQVLLPLVIPFTRAAGPPTSSTTTTSPSPVEPSAAGPHVTAEDGIRAVGSLLIQQAAAKRRKSDGIYECPFPNCNSTFTKAHNLEYHIYAHMGLKPYKCSTCGFATAYPTALGSHMKRRHTIEGMCEPESS
ncbi:hypothetical protein M378DRAFT_339968 [Amanita muscaria Koide BX008]|uniref:C2H2-type domain-containing protein n=1 Tax=Amanita muscaria (strain Koide BX008) TaxID=946122 RepID=A0A0C2WA51_AMAMK|nr:hypothetical protein M378DRAFT_339968 [Amanita muscaria Koide BX008]